jgi:hypothetical protein
MAAKDKFSPPWKERESSCLYRPVLSALQTVDNFAVALEASHDEHATKVRSKSMDVKRGTPILVQLKQPDHPDDRS